MFNRGDIDVVPDEYFYQYAEHVKAVNDKAYTYNKSTKNSIDYYDIKFADTCDNVLGASKDPPVLEMVMGGKAVKI